RVIMTLSHFASGVDPVVPVLMNDLKENTGRYPPDYFGAARELHASSAVIPILIKSLESDNWMVQEAAALLLPHMDPAPPPPRPPLDRCRQESTRPLGRARRGESHQSWAECRLDGARFDTTDEAPERYGQRGTRHSLGSDRSSRGDRAHSRRSVA